MTSTARTLLVVMLAIATSACAGSASSGTREAGRTDRLTQADIGDTSYPDLYAFVQAKRSSWLQPRSYNRLGNSTGVQVYRDDVRIGGVAALRGIHPMEMEYVRYFDPIQASSRWGFDHGSGVIFVASRRN